MLCENIANTLSDFLSCPHGSFQLYIFICAFCINIVFILLIVEVLLSFPLLAAALFIEDETIRLLTGAAALSAAGNSVGAAKMLTVGQNKLNLALKLVTVSPLASNIVLIFC